MTSSHKINETHVPVSQHWEIISKAFSIFLSLLPVIAIYKSGIPGLNAADLILAVFCIISLCDNRTRKKPILEEKLLVAFCLYIFIVPMLLAVIDRTINADILIRTIRICFYLFSVVFVSRKLLMPKIFRKSVLLVTVLGIFFIILQYIAYYAFRYVLNGFLPFWPLYTSAYSEMNYSAFYMEHFFRPTSFFLEPAHFSRYAIVGLVIVLFDANTIKKKWLSMFLGFLISIGVVLSTSGQGIVYVVLILICYFFTQLNNTRIRARHWFFLTGSLVLLVLALGWDFFENIVVRFSFTNGIFNKSSALFARLGTITELSKASLLKLVFGHGYGAVPYENAWMSGVTYIVHGGGLIAFAVILFLVVHLLFSATAKKIKAFLLVYLLLLAVDDSFNSYMSVFYFSFILYAYKTDTVKMITDLVSAHE